MIAEAIDELIESVLARRQYRRRRRALAPIERVLGRQIGRAFRAQGRAFARLLAGLRDRFPAEAVLQEALREHEWGPLFSEAELVTLQAFVRPIDRAAQRALLAGARHVIADADAGISFDLANPRAVSFLERYGAERVTKINSTTKDAIRRIMVQSVDEGWSYNRTAQAITERFRDFAVGKPQLHIDSRAHLVAVTEPAEAYGEGKHQAAREVQSVGLPMEHYWQTVGDGRVSDGCRENQAAGWIPLEQAFPSGHLHEPRFPGCRCDVLVRRRRE